MDPKDTKKNLRLSEREKEMLKKPFLSYMKEWQSLTVDMTGSRKSNTLKVLRENYFTLIVLYFWQLSINFRCKIYFQICKCLVSLPNTLSSYF